MIDLNKRIGDLSPEKRVLLEALLKKQGVNLSKSAIVPRREDGNRFPLSFAQQRLWFIDQLEPNSSSYNIPSAMPIQGELDLQSLQRSVNEVVKRHESLRTRFANESGKPVQVIAEPSAVDIPLIDLSHLDEQQREAESQRLAREEASEPFELSEGPLMRVRIVRQAVDQQVVLLTMHHIISDGWSMNVLMEEVSHLYEAYSNNRESQLPELEIQYADYAVWQRGWLSGETLDSELAYWKKQLEGAPAVMSMPTDRPRPAVQSFRGASQEVELSEELSRKVGELARRHGATVYMVLLAGFKALMSRYSGERDIVVGTPVAGRNRIETERLIGPFVNTLVMRTEVRGEESFRELLGRVRESVLEGQSHQELPFEKLVEEMQPERSLSYSPIFQVMFSLNNTSSVRVGSSEQSSTTQTGQAATEPIASAQSEAATSAPGFSVEARTSKFDLNLVMTERGDRISGSLEYSSDLFDHSTIHRLISHFINLLHSVSVDDRLSISLIPLLSDHERFHILSDWNQTHTDFPLHSTIADQFSIQVSTRSDALAVVFNDVLLTYRDLDERANQLANFLISHGIGPESLVGVCLHRSAELIVTLLAIVKAGAAYVPLDPAYPRPRLEFMVEDSQASLIVSSSELADSLPLTGAALVMLDQQRQQIEQHSPIAPVVEHSAGNLAYVTYTSGSTGRPKGVSIEQRGVLRLVKNNTYAKLDEQETLLQLAPVAFDASTLEIWGSLLNGGKLVVMPGQQATLHEIGEQIQKQGVTTLWLTAGLFHQMVEEEVEKLAGVRQLLAGGDVLRAGAVKKVMREVKGVEVINGYGPTENTTFTCCNRMREEEEVGWNVSIGRAIGSTRVYVLDKELNPTPVGVAGELWTSGEGLARGYLNRPDLTAERFMPDPHSEEGGARMYATGDEVRYREDGKIEFIGRRDKQVKVRGYRIELGEIEEEMMRVRGVGEAAAVVREDEEGEKRIVGYVVAEEGEEVSEREIREEMKERVPEYMRPWAIVVMDRMPLTTNGKLDRNALPAPDALGASNSRNFIAPRDIVEFKLVQIWQELLDASPISVRDNFFLLGGHSLLAVRLMARIKQQFGKSLPLTTLLQGGTIEYLAAEIRREGDSSSGSPLLVLQLGNNRQPFFCVHPAGGGVLCYKDLVGHLGPDQPFYAFQAQGFEEGQIPRDDLESMAREYISALRSVQPRGPYLLGGWSMGGIVAYEMARQLREQGEEIAMLTLLDVKCPTTEIWNGEDDEDIIALARTIALFARDLGISVTDIFQNWDHLISLKPQEQLPFILEMAKRADLVPPDLSLEQALRIFKVFKANVRAMRRYQPKGSDLKITLIRASERVMKPTKRQRVRNLLQRTPILRKFYRDSQNETLGWDALAFGGVEIHWAPGNHDTMVEEPNVRVVAERLRACLEQARAEGSSQAINHSQPSSLAASV